MTQIERPSNVESTARWFFSAPSEPVRVRRGDPNEGFKFIEYKYTLSSSNFNHSFKHLRAIVCWKVSLPDGARVRDTADKSRTLREHDEYEFPAEAPYTLNEPQHLLKVYSRRDILFDRLGAQVAPRQQE